MRNTITVRTFIEASFDHTWLITVQNSRDALQTWSKRYADGLTAQREAAELGLVNQQATFWASRYGIDVRDVFRRDRTIEIEQLEQAGFSRDA